MLCRRENLVGTKFEMADREMAEERRQHSDQSLTIVSCSHIAAIAQSDVATIVQKMISEINLVRLMKELGAGGPGICPLERARSEIVPYSSSKAIKVGLKCTHVS